MFDVAIGHNNEEYQKKENIVNNTITAEDVDRAWDIFGIAKEIASRKMIAPWKRCNQSSQVLLHDLVPPIDHRLKMYIDILYINGHPYLHTKTKEVNYITISKLQSRKVRDIKRKLKNIIKKYLTRGFILNDIFDNRKVYKSCEGEG